MKKNQVRQKDDFCRSTSTKKIDGKKFFPLLSTEIVLFVSMNDEKKLQRKKNKLTRKIKQETAGRKKAEKTEATKGKKGNDSFFHIEKKKTKK